MFTSDREAYYWEHVRKYGPTYAEFDLPTTELVLSILFSYDLLHQCSAKYMAEFGLSKSTFNVLLLLRHGPPEGMQLHDLGEKLLVSRANVTGLISHLEGMGLVTREVDEQDRRARYAKVTPKAKELLNELMPIHYRNIKAIMSDLPNSVKEDLIRLLGEARNSIQKHSEVCERLTVARNDRN